MKFLFQLSLSRINKKKFSIQFLLSRFIINNKVSDIHSRHSSSHSSLVLRIQHRHHLCECYYEIWTSKLTSWIRTPSLGWRTWLEFCRFWRHHVTRRILQIQLNTRFVPVFRLQLHCRVLHQMESRFAFTCYSKWNRTNGETLTWILH